MWRSGTVVHRFTIGNADSESHCPRRGASRVACLASRESRWRTPGCWLRVLRAPSRNTATVGAAWYSKAHIVLIYRSRRDFDRVSIQPPDPMASPLPALGSRQVS